LVIERLLDWRPASESENPHGKEEFLVKWRGYDASEASWEPRTNLGARAAVLVKTLWRSRRATRPPDPERGCGPSTTSWQPPTIVGSCKSSNMEVRRWLAKCYGSEARAVAAGWRWKVEPPDRRRKGSRVVYSPPGHATCTLLHVKTLNFLKGPSCGPGRPPDESAIRRVVQQIQRRKASTDGVAQQVPKKLKTLTATAAASPRNTRYKLSLGHPARLATQQENHPPTLPASAGALLGALPECVVCMDAPVEKILAPCGHMCLCARCATKVKKRRGINLCPVCRDPIESVLKHNRIFVAGEG
jgi:hypothetical protein